MLMKRPGFASFITIASGLLLPGYSQVAPRLAWEPRRADLLSALDRGGAEVILSARKWIGLNSHF